MTLTTAAKLVPTIRPVDEWLPLLVDDEGSVVDDAVDDEGSVVDDVCRVDVADLTAAVEKNAAAVVRTVDVAKLAETEAEVEEVLETVKVVGPESEFEFQVTGKLPLLV